MGHAEQAATVPASAGTTGTTSLPSGFLTLDYPGSAEPGRQAPPITTPSFLPPPSPTAPAEAGSPPPDGSSPSSTRRRLDPRRRRMVEALALALLVPLTLGLQWFDQKKLVEAVFAPEEAITVVPRAKTAEMAHARWVMGGRLPNASNGLSTASKVEGATKITLLVGVKALDPQGSKEASVGNLKFRLVDRAGNKWEANADYKGEDGRFVGNPPVGKAIPIHVTAEVPAQLADQLVLDVMQTGPHRPKGPVRVLRFAH